MIPAKWHYGKDKPMKIIKVLMVTGGCEEEEVNSESTEDVAVKVLCLMLKW